MGILTLDEYLKKKKEEENNNTIKSEDKTTSSKIMTLDEYNRSRASLDNVLTLDEYLSKNNKNSAINEKKEENTWFKKSELYKDNKGNVITDAIGTGLATIGDVGVNLAKGAGGLVEGVGDLISYGVADVQDWTGHEEAAEKTRANAQKNTVDELFKPTTDYLDKYSILGEKTDGIAEGLGYVAAITAVSALSGGAGAALGGSSATAATIGSTAATFTSAMGNGMTEALNDGADIDQARIYGAISGAGEAVSELAFGGLGKASEAMGLSRGALDDVLAGGLTKNIKNKMLKTIAQSGIKAGGEGFEEVLSGLISAVGKKVTYMSEKEFSQIAKDENLAEQFWMGALTSAITQGPSTIRSVKNGTDYITGKTSNEQKVYDNEVKARTNDKIRQSSIEQAYNEQIKAKENLGIEITDKVKAETMKKVENAYDNGTLKHTELSKKDLREIEKQVDTDMQEGNISIENIIEVLGENQDISKDNLLMRSKYENEQKYNSYQVEKTDNEKVNVLMQSATNAGMNNTTKTRKKVELISKLVKDTDRQYKFVSPEQLKEMGHNENANGLINKSTGEILINARSDKGLQSIVGHETTHIFDSKNSKGTYSKEYQTLQDVAIEYAKTKGIYDSKIQSITEAYGDLLVDESQIKEELTADLVGDFLFNDEKFIENLAVKDRNIFQKIYDYIKHTYKMLKGTDEEKAFENLKRQFEKVYKTVSTETNTDIKYSIAGEKAIENIKNTKFYKDAEDNLKLAKRLKEAGKSNLELVKETGWFQDQAGDWKFEFSDRNMELKEINFTINKEYNLSDVLEHDELFYFYPELANYTVIFDNKTNSSYSEKNKTIYLSNNKLNNLTDLKGTLVHEIQHTIQNIENHAHGTTTKLGLMRYYNALGEIEAADTKQRYLNNVEGKRNTILPESGKKNPTHIKVKNGDTLVKIANGVYNFFHGGEKNVYKNKRALEENYEGNRPLVVERGRLSNKIANTQESENNSGSFNLSPENQKYSMTNDTYITGDDIAVKDMLKRNIEQGNTLDNIIGTPQTNKQYEKKDSNNYINNEKFPILEANKENRDKKLTRKEVKKQLLEKMNIKEADISVGEDISALNFQITDPIRVNEKVFGRKIGSKINEVTINQTKHNTAEKIRWQNKEREEIASLGIKARSKESAAVQKYGEKKYVDEFGNSHDYGDIELANEFHDTKTQEKIKYAATVIRNKYDNYIDSANNILTRLGYDEIPKRKDYMRHFQELTDKFSEIGIPLNLNDLKAEDLPTDINGLTEFNKPGKSWFASAMKRTGEKTVYDAVTGIDGYIEGIGNIIFHTEDVQNYRALSSLIRDTYGQTHGFDNLDNMTEEAMKRIKDIQNNKLSKYVAWLDEQANSLAGKKGAIDRGFERFLGRKVYTVFNTAKKQVGSNMTGFNIRACLTNLVSSILAASKTKKVAFVKGTISTINNIFKQDDFIDKSDFLTSRFGSNLLSQKFWQKASNAGQIFMSGTDWFTSNQIVRSKYYEGLSKGMTESEAIKYADDFASRVMGDRSQGATAELFNSKTLGLFTQFQLEVNNQWQFMMHDTKMDYQQNKEENNGLKAGAAAVFQMGQLAAYSYFFNELFEKLTGSRAAFDPIEIMKVLFGYDDDDDEKTFDERLSEAGKLLVENIPFANLFTDGGRIPVSEAFTGISTLGKKLTGGTDEYGNELTWQNVKEDVLKTIPYWVMPTGYSQAKKTAKGLSMYLNDIPGSYNNSGDLRYTVDDDVGSKVQATIFGAYANPYAQDYIDNGYKTIKKDNIDEMVGLNMNSTEYRQYKNGLSKVSKTTDKNGYKQYTDDSNNVYWYDANSEVMYDSDYNKTTLTEDDLTKTVKTEEALDYINSLDLTDTQKNLAANNLNKNSKKKIDMLEYGKYSSYDEYKYARDNPEKYSVVSKITDYDSYTKYKDAIADIKKQYSTELGYESKERKVAVQSYINSLDLNIYQKMMLEKMAGGYSIKDYQNYIYEYLESTDLTDSEKYTMWEELFN